MSQFDRGKLGHGEQEGATPLRLQGFRCHAYLSVCQRRQRSPPSKTCARIGRLLAKPEVEALAGAEVGGAAAARQSLGIASPLTFAPGRNDDQRPTGPRSSLRLPSLRAAPGRVYPRPRRVSLAGWPEWRSTPMAVKWERIEVVPACGVLAELQSRWRKQANDLSARFNYGAMIA
jgi:hypothetical protein